MKTRHRSRPQGHEAAAPRVLPARRRALDGFFERRGGPLVLLAMALYGVVYGGLCVYKFRHYLYDDFDLAIFAHATSQILRGTLDESIGGMPWLGGHFAPVMFLLAPLWAVAHHPLVLLLAQTVALASGAWAVRRIALREVRAPAAAVVLPGLWLLHPALGYFNLFEFHPECFATPALLFAFDALRAGRLRAMTAWTVLALITREDVALVVLPLALFASLPPRPGGWKAPVLLAGLALAALATCFGLVMPAFGSGQTDYAQLYGRWGHSLREMFSGVAHEPLRALAELAGTPGNTADTTIKRLYYLQLLLPLGFLSLACPAVLLLPAPIVLEHFLSVRLPEHSIVHHYTALVLPLVMAAAVLGLANIERRERTRRWAGPLLGVALVAGLASQWLFGPLFGTGRLQALGSPEALQQAEYDRTLEPWRDAMVRRVPRKGGVVAGFELLLRFTDREGLYSLHHLLAGHYTLSHRPYRVPMDVGAVIADLGAGNLFKWVDAGTASRWRALLAGNDLHPVDAANDLVLFTHGARDTVSLWEIAEPRVPRKRPVVYDRTVAYVGGEVSSHPVRPGERVPIRTFWRRVANTDRFFLTEIVVLDPAGKPRVELWRYLGYTLNPVILWPESTSVCETFHLAVPPGSAPGRYHVGYRLWWRHDGQGVCEPDDPAVRAEDGYVTVGSFDVTPP